MNSIQDPAVFLTSQRASLARFIVAQVYGVPVGRYENRRAGARMWRAPGKSPFIWRGWSLS